MRTNHPRFINKAGCLLSLSPYFLTVYSSFYLYWQNRDRGEVDCSSAIYFIDFFAHGFVNDAPFLGGKTDFLCHSRLSSETHSSLCYANLFFRVYKFFSQHKHEMTIALKGREYCLTQGLNPMPWTKSGYSDWK